MFGALDISTSALIAQRTRMTAIAQNMANQNTVIDAKGNYNPYQRRMVVFAQGDPTTGNSKGVHVREILLDKSFQLKPVGKDHPGADENGNLKVPNVHPAVELTDAMLASRAYEANITAIEATKSMANSALQLIA